MERIAEGALDPRPVERRTLARALLERIAICRDRLLDERASLLSASIISIGG